MALALAACLSLSAAAADAQIDSPPMQVERQLGRGAEKAPESEVSPPKPGTARAQAAAALDGAEALVLYSLQPWAPPYREPPRGADAATIAAMAREDAGATERSRFRWCKHEACLYGNKILGKVALRREDDRKAALTALRESLRLVPEYSSMCMAEYRHAIEFVSAGKRYEILLCYQCGQVRTVVDGDARESYGEQAFSMGDVKALNAIFKREHVPLAKSHED